MNIDLNSFSCCQAGGCGVSKAPIDRGAVDKMRAVFGWHMASRGDIQLNFDNQLTFEMH